MGNSNDPEWRNAINHMLHFSFVLKAETEVRLNDELGIGLADHEGLMNLKASGGSLRMSEIAERLVLSRGGITKLVDRLEERGYVHRAPSTQDRRVTLVEITESGKETAGQSRLIIDELLVARWGDRITDEEARFITELIRRAYHDEHSELIDRQSDAG